MIEARSCPLSGLEAPIFPPPAAAASFYVGDVVHHRMKPRQHRFKYSVFSLLIDLKRLEEASRLSRFFSINRFNLLSFSERDHGPFREQGDPLAAASRLLREAGVEEAPQRVLLLCYPRVLGFVFNPLATYFIYGAGDRLIGVIYEVRNTFAERHSYVAPVLRGELSEAGLRQRADKLFYVSPFIDAAMTYHFRLRPPGEQELALRIHETDAPGPILAAMFAGKREAVHDRSCLRLALTMPLMTLKVVIGINFEALRLWLKGIKLVHRPTVPPAASRDGQFLTRSAFSVRKQDHAG
jgi:uncharacterized protein